MRPRPLFLAGAAAAVLAAPAAALAGEGSLPSVGSGHRPGPDALYAPPPEEVPQLENAAPWKAEPILVSGSQAYRNGEWLYQDFLHDDHGAAGVKDTEDPWDLGSFTFSPTAGTLTYPSHPVFANNAADLVELRVKRLANATALRITLNTLQDPERTAVTIALGAPEAEAREWPHGAGVSSPADLFLTVHGGSAELVDAASGDPLTPAPSASVDARRRQLEVRVSHAAWNPGSGKVRLTAGAGLWDPEAGGYLTPGTSRSETAPGGVAPSRAALFNVAPRFEEPYPDVTQNGLGATIADAAVGAAVDAAWWRERAQADALRLGDVGGFFAEIDFAKLAAGTRDDSQVPTTGPINRILASRHSFGQGVDHERVCFDLAGGGATDPTGKCDGRFLGQLQPYSLYVPEKDLGAHPAEPDASAMPQPAGGWGLTLLLHSLSANYNQYSASKNQSQLGDRAAGTLVVTPNGRGPDGFYNDMAEADTFEVWADVARRYELDPDWAAVSGYSMGGFGTFRLLARYPDLFARGMSTVGVPDDAMTLPSLRNTPIMTWAAAADELVNISETEEATRQLEEAGLRFTADLFPAADHLTLATNDEYGPAADFLGEHRADRSPPHVTYVVAPVSDSERAGAVADHAYWLSGLTLRDPEAGDGHGTIDARSEAFGVGDAEVLGVEQGGGAVEGGERGPAPYVRRSQEWGEEPAAPAADKLVVKATNVATATVDVRRARLSCAPLLEVETDGPLELRLGSATVKLPEGRTLTRPPASPRSCRTRSGGR